MQVAIFLEIINFEHLNGYTQRGISVRCSLNGYQNY